MKQYVKKFIIAIAAIIITIFLNINIEMGISFFERFNGDSVLYLTEAILIGILINKVSSEKNRRLIIISLIISAVLATAEIIGTSLNTYLAINLPKCTILKWFAYFALFTCVIIWLFNYLDVYKNTGNTGKIRLFLNEKRSIIVVALIIFILWIPYFIKFYPGAISPDSISQLNQIAGIEQVNNHHPVFHTLLIAIFVKIGLLFGDYNTGVALYSIFQMIAMSSIFSFALYYFNKKGVSNIILVLSFLFFAIYPAMPMYSITMWKDILFGGIMLLYTICITELVVNKNKFISNKNLLVLFSIIILLVMLLRNNGFYVILLSLPFLLLLNKDIWKKLLIVFVIPIIAYILITGPLFNLINIKPGSIREALSVPIQQLTRVAKLEKDSLTDEEYNLINKYIHLDNFDYNPILSDPAKNNFDDVLFNENKMEFISLWVHLFFKHPVQYVEAFLSNNYGYWYPEAMSGLYYQDVWQNDLGLKQERNDNMPTIEEIMRYRRIPINNQLYCLGFMVWAIFIALMYMVYKKQYKFLSIYVGIIALWITILASPVFCEYRYLYGMVTCLPILLFLPFWYKEFELKE